MGVTGLLPLLKKASTNCNARRFSGCTAAVDAYGWLHKGAFGCAVQLGKGEPTTAYITYCVKYLNLLLSHNIRPLMVLDGRNLPSKAVTEVKRREKRQENRENAREFLRKGMKKEAWECFTRCVDITPAMAREFIKVLREMKIDYIVAPYEADAQLAYLARNNIVDVVITEDSDLILFGCPKIFYKMSITGDGVLFDAAKIPICLGIKPEQFDFERFRFMCILSGCDYLPSLPGIGLGRAKKLIDATTSQDIRKILKSIPKILRIEVDVTDEYIQGFLQAELTFMYQLCYDTVKKRLVPLTPYAADVKRDDLIFAGSYVDNKLARDMALGNVDLHTLQKVDSFDPNKPHSGYNGSKSIWSNLYTIPTQVKVVTARDMKSKAQHSSTKGMQANVSISSVLKRKHVTVSSVEINSGASSTSEADNDKDDADLLLMYRKPEDSDSPDFEICEIETGLSYEEITKSAKRKRAWLSQQSSEEDERDVEEDGDENKEQEQLYKRRSTRRNPFLKSTGEKPSQIKIDADEDVQDVTTSPPKPICLIERNKVYENGTDIKVVIKSHYFRSLDNGLNSPATAKEECSIIVKHELNELTFKGDCTLTNESVEIDSQDSQVTIYSLDDDIEDDSIVIDDEDFPSLDKNNPTTPSPSSVASNKEEDDEDPFPANVRARLRNSFLKSSPKKGISPKKRISPRKGISSKAKSGTTSRVGMSKTALKKSAVPGSKQQTLSAMFGLKARPKI